MGASQLSIYNGALRYLQERKLANLKENREPRRYMDDEYAENVEFCLSQGNWTWSLREVQLFASETLIPNFGFSYAFPKPLDWNHVYQIADNESYNPLLRYYTDQNGIIYAAITPLYARYVSNDPHYGWNMAMWTPPFIEYVEVRLAWLCAPRIMQNAAKVQAIADTMKRTKAMAINKDSQNMPPGIIPYGTWTMSRAPRGSITPLGNPYAGSNN